MIATIRMAGPDDLDTIARIVAELDKAHQHHHPDLLHQGEPKPIIREKFLEMFDADDMAIFMAEVEGETAGYVRVQFSAREENRVFKAHTIAHVHELAVTAAWQGKGIGRQLMQAVHDEADRRGVERISIGHFIANDGAGRFYERLGYTPFIRTLTYLLKETP